MTRKTFVIALCAIGLAAHGAVNWDDALIFGRTNGDKCFYAAGEEMVFTLELKGVKGEIPSGEYFIDWVRSANDGKTEKGRAEASLAKPLVNVQKADGSIRTQMLMRPDADNFWINCMGASIRALDLLAETK